MWFRYKPYVNVAQRRAKAAKVIKKIERGGRKTQPVNIEGGKIARTFWGKAWCDNLESYSDFSNRLPRGRTYVRNGSVCDLQILPGKVIAMVCGSEMYNIQIDIDPAKTECWNTLKRECSGQIAAVVELLRGEMSDAVMKIITRPGSGLFPKPDEIEMECSCPDWAGMCKHVAAVMYGIGARLDQQPDLLFLLREVDHLELISDAGNIEPISDDTTRKTIAAGDLSEVFGIEMSQMETEIPAKRKAVRNHGRKYAEKTTKTAARSPRVRSKSSKKASSV